MKIHILCAIAALVCASPALAQDRPDFTGTWKAAVGGSNGNQQDFDVDWYLRVVQGESQIVLVKDMDSVGLEHRLTYLLDGSESRNRTATVTGAQWNHVSRAQWIESQLVVATTTTWDSGNSYESITTYSLDPDGRLRVSTDEPCIDGGLCRETTLWAKL